MLSTFKGWKDVNTPQILESYVAGLPGHWQVTADAQVTKPVGGKLPMAFSVGPKVGPNWLAIGDASGAVNPFNGEGIDYAYETGRLAATFIAEALAADDLSLLARYAVAHNLVDRTADGFGKTAIVERRRDRALLVDDVVMADLIEFGGGDAGFHIGFDHLQHFRCESPGDTHLLHFLGRFDGYTHSIQIQFDKVWKLKVFER